MKDDVDQRFCSKLMSFGPLIGRSSALLTTSLELKQEHLVSYELMNE